MKSNEELLSEFIQDMIISKGIKEKRVKKYNCMLRIIFKIIDKPILKMTKDDIDSYVMAIKNDNKHKELTKSDYLIIFKTFGTWVKKKYNLVHDFNSIKVTAREKTRMPDELLTDNEVEKLIECCSNARDKSFFAVLWDSGCRISELLNLKIKHIVFDKYGTVIMIDGKTGQRRVRLIDSTPLIYEYLQSHDKRDNPESYVWFSDYSRRSKKEGNRPLSHGAVYLILHELCKKAKIKKRVFPHLFRHSRATFYANKLTEAQMKEHFGWTQSSDMASVYVHLSGRDVDNGILKAHGIKEDEETPKTLFLSRFMKKDDSVEALILDFLKIIADENPNIKERFKQMVKERNLESVFK